MRRCLKIFSFLGGVVAPLAAVAGSPHCGGGSFSAPFSSCGAPVSQSAVYSAPMTTYAQPSYVQSFAQPTYFAQSASVVQPTFFSAPAATTFSAPVATTFSAPTTTLVPQFSYVSAQPVTSFAMPTQTFSAPVTSFSATAQSSNCGSPFSSSSSSFGGSAQAGELLAWIGVIRELQGLGLFGRSSPGDNTSPGGNQEIQDIKTRLTRIETHLGFPSSGGAVTDLQGPQVPAGAQSQTAGGAVNPLVQIMMDYQAARDQQMLDKIREALK